MSRRQPWLSGPRPRIRRAPRTSLSSYGAVPGYGRVVLIVVLALVDLTLMVAPLALGWIAVALDDGRAAGAGVAVLWVLLWRQIRLSNRATGETFRRIAEHIDG